MAWHQAEAKLDEALGLLRAAPVWVAPPPPPPPPPVLATTMTTTTTTAMAMATTSRDKDDDDDDVGGGGGGARAADTADPTAAARRLAAAAQSAAAGLLVDWRRYHITPRHLTSCRVISARRPDSSWTGGAPTPCRATSPRIMPCRIGAAAGLLMDWRRSYATPRHLAS